MMVKRQPIAKNKREKPVLIFKNGEELDEFPSIQKAAKWLKKYVGYQNLPFKQVYNGILYGEEWEFNGDVYSFTTDENIRLATLKNMKTTGTVESKEEKKEELKVEKVQPTGYWTFFCNPQKWEIDEFLLSGNVFDSFTISAWQKDWFKKGQLGVIRVGHDQRTNEALTGKQRLKRGIYAIVEILGAPTFTTDNSKFRTQTSEEEKYRVPIKYLKGLLSKPILFNQLELNSSQHDNYLISGSQASSMPLNPNAFTKIIQLLGGMDTLEMDFGNTDTMDAISELENAYIDAVPEVTQRLSDYIESGTIAQKYKKIMHYTCQVCEAMEKTPYSFKKPNGEFYIETHHVMPEVGKFVTNNLITVCPNHHRQLHYGNVKLLENTENHFVFSIDNKNVQIKK